MRKRNVHLQLWLYQSEADHLDNLALRSNLTRSAYIRQLIGGVIPRDAPPPDYFKMMRELHAIGNNLNQIAHKAHQLGVIDVKRYDEGMRALEAAIKAITQAVIVPTSTS